MRWSLVQNNWNSGWVIFKSGREEGGREGGRKRLRSVGGERETEDKSRREGCCGRRCGVREKRRERACVSEKVKVWLGTDVKRELEKTRWQRRRERERVSVLTELMSIQSGLNGVLMASGAACSMRAEARKAAHSFNLHKDAGLKIAWRCHRCFFKMHPAIKYAWAFTAITSDWIFINPGG